MRGHDGTVNRTFFLLLLLLVLLLLLLTSGMSPLHCSLSRLCPGPNQRHFMTRPRPGFPGGWSFGQKDMGHSQKRKVSSFFGFTIYFLLFYFL